MYWYFSTNNEFHVHFQAHSSYCLVEFNLWQEDWQKEKRDFLQSLSRISTLPRTNMIDTSNVGTRPGQLVASSPQTSSGIAGTETVPLASKPVVEKKAAVYAEVVKNLNKAREGGLPFKVRPVLSESLLNLESDITALCLKMCDWRCSFDSNFVYDDQLSS